MERKTHILFTITWIYWIAALPRIFWVTNELVIYFSVLVSMFPLISLPYQAIVTCLPDIDTPKTRFKRSILLPAALIIWFFAKHRWFTHRLSWILSFSFITYLLYLWGTNIITVSIYSFLAITIIWLLIDDFKLNIFWFRITKFFWRKFDPKLIDKTLSLIILLFSPTLLDETNYVFFLISLNVAYIFHMLWDAFSKEWWTIIELPGKKNKIKFQMPSFLAFKVWWFIERKIKTILIVMLILLLIFDFNFILSKIIEDLKLSYNTVIWIYNNPEILYDDIGNIKERWSLISELIIKSYIEIKEIFNK